MESNIRIDYDRLILGLEEDLNTVGSTDSTLRTNPALDADTIFMSDDTGDDGTGTGSRAAPVKTYTKAKTLFTTHTHVGVLDDADYTFSVDSGFPVYADQGQTPRLTTVTVNDDIHGFILDAASQTLQGSEIHYCTIQNASSFTTNGSVTEVFNCIFIDNTALPTFSPGAAGNLHIKECLFVNNTLSDLTIDGSGAGIIVEYCNVYGNSELICTNNSGSEIFRYNISSGNSAADWLNTGTAITITNSIINSFGGLNGIGDNILDPVSIIADPLFRDITAPTFDFKPQAISNGNALNSLAVEFSAEVHDLNQGEARTSAQSLLFGGEMFSFFGVDLASSAVFDEIKKFNIENQQFYTITPTGSTPSARLNHSIVLIDGEIYIYGGVGVGGSPVYQDTWKYSIRENTWTNLAPTGTPNAVGLMAYGTDGDDFYIYGGEDSTATVLNEVWKYDVSDNTWTELTLTGDTPPTLLQCEMGYIGNSEFILFGGNDLSVGPTDTYRLNVKDLTWDTFSTTTDPGGFIGGHRIVTRNNQVYLFGGEKYPSAAISSELWTYNDTTGDWSEVSDNGANTAVAHSFGYDSMNDKFVYFYGLQPSSANKIWEYDVDTDAWSEITTSNVKRDVGCYNVLHNTLTSYLVKNVIAPFKVGAQPVSINYRQVDAQDGNRYTFNDNVQLEIMLEWDLLSSADSKFIRDIIIQNSPVRLYPNPSNEPDYFLQCEVLKSSITPFVGGVRPTAALTKPRLVLSAKITESLNDLRNGEIL